MIGRNDEVRWHDTAHDLITGKEMLTFKSCNFMKSMLNVNMYIYGDRDTDFRFITRGPNDATEGGHEKSRKKVERVKPEATKVAAGKMVKVEPIVLFHYFFECNSETIVGFGQSQKNQSITPVHS